MARPKAVNPPVLLKAMVPADLRGRMDLELVSDVEGRIPHGEISRWVTERLREYFAWTSLDLQPYGFPQGFFVRGPAEMVEAVKRRFTGAPLAPGHTEAG